MLVILKSLVYINVLVGFILLSMMSLYRITIADTKMSINNRPAASGGALSWLWLWTAAANV